jgi:hypothetical protein
MSRKAESFEFIDSPGRRRLPPLLRRAWYGLNRAFRRRIAHIGLTPDRIGLAHAARAQGVSQRRPRR